MLGVSAVFPTTCTASFLKGGVCCPCLQVRALLIDPAWLEVKLHCYGVAVVVDDFRSYLQVRAYSQPRLHLPSPRLSYVGLLSVVCLSLVCHVSIAGLSFVGRLSVLCLSAVCPLCVSCLSLACALSVLSLSLSTPQNYDAWP
jgi:hypothetical protein